MPASIQIPATFTAKDKFTRTVSKMTKSVRTFSGKSVAYVKRFDHKLNNTFRKVNRLGLMIGGLAIGAIFSTAIQNNLAYNDSLASVSAITGATGNDLIELEKTALSTAKTHKKSGAEILKAYELVGSAKPELLSNISALDAVTQSVITLSKASRLDMETSALSLTAVMNQFNKDASESGMVIDALAAGAKYGAAAIPAITEAIQQFGTGAKAFNVNVVESVALVETLAAKGIKGAEAGTKLRNILSKMSAIDALPKSAIDQLKKFGVNTDIVSNKALPLNERLKELSKISGDATALVKVFGIQNKEAGQIILENIPLYEQMNKNIAETGVAQTQAATNTNTLKFALDSIKTAFLNATTATNGNNKSLQWIIKSLNWVAKNMQTIITVVGILIGSFIAMKVIIGIINAVQVAIKIWTAVQWLLNASLWANPIGVVIAVIVALIAVVVGIIAAIKNWGSITDWFSKKWKQFTGWISKLWSGVVNFFKEFDFKAMFVKIGQSILKFMLLPLKGVLTLLSKLPGKVGELAKMGLEKIGAITGEVEVKDGKKALPSTAQSASENVSKTVEERNKNSNVKIDIVDKGRNVGDVESDDVPVNIGSTAGAF